MPTWFVRAAVAATCLALTACGMAGSRANAAHAGDPRFLSVSSMSVDGVPLAELSGLAWDADARQLWAVSDQGGLYRLAIRWHGGRLDAVRPVSATWLRTADEPGHRFNAEGLALRHADDGVPGNTELLVALEENPPRVAHFDAAGKLEALVPLPSALRDIRHYRKKGRGLESVLMHPGYGLMTAPESPLRGQPDDRHTVYAQGHAWSFPRHAEGSRLKGLEVLPDGSLLVLERSRPDGDKHEQVASLRRVNLAACDTQGRCPTDLVTVLPPGPQNFEGMTLLDAHHVLLASDNGGKGSVATTFVLVVLP